MKKKPVNERIRRESIGVLPRHWALVLDEARNRDCSASRIFREMIEERYRHKKKARKTA